MWHLTSASVPTDGRARAATMVSAAAAGGQFGRVLFSPSRCQRPLLCSPQPCAPRPASTTGGASGQTGATAARAGSGTTVPGNLTPHAAKQRPQSLAILITKRDACCFSQEKEVRILPLLNRLL